MIEILSSRQPRPLTPWTGPRSRQPKPPNLTYSKDYGFLISICYLIKNFIDKCCEPKQFKAKSTDCLFRNVVHVRYRLSTVYMYKLHILYKLDCFCKIEL